MRVLTNEEMNWVSGGFDGEGGGGDGGDPPSGGGGSGESGSDPSW